MGLLPNSLFTMFQGKSGGRGLSPRLWSKAYGQAQSPDGFSNAYWDSDDFMRFGQINPGAGGTTTGVAHNGYGYYVDTATAAGSIMQLASMVGGGARFTTSTQDNHEATMTGAGNTGTQVVVSNSSGSSRLMVFEARFRVGQVSGHNVFVGLTEEGLAANDGVFTDAGALTSKDMLGFWILEADGTSLKYGYRIAGQAVQTVGTFGTALAANTWYKVGLIYDPSEQSSKRIKFFVDNIEQSSYVSSTNIAAATFPNGEELATTFSMKNGTAAARTFDVDWYSLFQQG